MTPPEDPRIDWSYSNASLYETCPRAFYYRHCGQSGVESTDSSNRRARSIGEAIGTAVHEGIASQMERWRVGKEPSLQAAQSVAASHLATIHPENGAQACVDIESSSAQTTVQNHIQRFFHVIWSRFTTHRYITHEQTSMFEVEGNRVWAKADLCTRDSDGTFVISDWKTRAPDVFENRSLQLTLYTLWAQTEFEPDVDRIRAQLIFTSNGEIVPQSVTESDLEELRSRISADLQVWNEEYTPSKFPVDPSAEKCSRCHYRPRCEAGQRAVKDDLK